MVQVKHRIRYPPFESGKLNAEHIPVVEYTFEVDGPVIPPFRLGNTDSWHVERVIEGDYESDNRYHGVVPQIIAKQSLAAKNCFTERLHISRTTERLIEVMKRSPI